MRIALLAVVAALAVAPAAALADHPQPTPDISLLPYQPEGHFKAGDPVPAHDQCQEELLPLTSGKKFNPSGVYNAFDTNVYEILCWPFRGAGDTTTDDPPGNGDPENPVHGHCSPNPEPRPTEEAVWSPIAGECPNHQLEYIEYYEETMQDILGDFGVTMHRYPFFNPGGTNTLSGSAINPAAVVPGADHPEEHIVIGAHYDKTTDGPASAWDSQEGHAQIIRIAKLMADYWDATGTRPAATVKFIPWDAEESGTFGSQDYAENNIVPSEEHKVRGYWNTDPCAGGYPAWRFGNPADRVPLGIQLARPEEIPDEYDAERVRRFNDAAPQIVEDVFEHLDDTTPNAEGDQEVFISKGEADADGAGGTQPDLRPGGPVTMGGSRPVLFGSDWVNFLARGVPFFNPGPEITGPSDENEPGNPDALAILHTPNDNIVTLNKYTGDPTGQMFSEAWMDGMEMCAHLLGWGMLRSDQGGAQLNDTEMVAYYEALPNEAEARRPVNFDASGSYRYTDAGTRAKADDSQFTYEWDFGDGTTGTGKEVQHLYDEPGVYQSKLTVTDTASGKTGTMSIPITVVGAVLDPPLYGDVADLDPDGNFELRWSYDEAQLEGFQRYETEEANDFRTAFADPAEDLPSRWEASEPTEETIQPWQHSDEGDSIRGNEHRSGERSFWTGISQDDQRPNVGPNYGVSKLTLKDSFQIAEDGELVYHSSFANDLNDRGRVEVGVEEGGTTKWVTVDRVRVEISADYYTAGFNDAVGGAPFYERRIDLGRFANKRIKLRFVYQLGASQYIDVERTGWYVDDIQVDTGTFRKIGDSVGKTFQVSGRTLGTYAYRVRGVHADAVSRYSAPETVRVTNPPTLVEPPTTALQPPTGTEGPSCRVVSGFRSVRVRPRRGGLRFSFSRRTLAPVRVDVFRQSSGRRLIGDRRVAFFGGRTKAFTWRARGRKVRNGSYHVRVSIPVRSGSRFVRDARRFRLTRRNGRFRLRRTFYRRPSCGILARFRLGRTVFGGRRNRELVASYVLSRQARVSAVVLRGRRVVLRYRGGLRPAGRVHRLRLRAKGLRRGEYRLRLTVVSGNTRVVSTLGARRL